MNKLLKIFVVVILFLFSYHIGDAQNFVAQADTSRANRNKTESMDKTKDKAQEGNGTQANNGKTNNQQKVKKVQSARPDMSKARGARPAYIQRQAGSGIPKGIGKPAGAGAIKPGKR
jgi:hypothetical protein